MFNSLSLGWRIKVLCKPASRLLGLRHSKGMDGQRTGSRQLLAVLLKLGLIRCPWHKFGGTKANLQPLVPIYSGRGSQLTFQHSVRESSPGTPSRLPLETQERIIGFLSPGSRDALRAALVCRAWYPRAIAVFYEQILFNSRDVFDKLVFSTRHNPRVNNNLSTTHTMIFRWSPCVPGFPLVLGAVLPSLTTLEIFGFKGSTPPLLFLRTVTNHDYNQSQNHRRLCEELSSATAAHLRTTESQAPGYR